MFRGFFSRASGLARSAKTGDEGVDEGAQPSENEGSGGDTHAPVLGAEDSNSGAEKSDERVALLEDAKRTSYGTFRLDNSDDENWRVKGKEQNSNSSAALSS
jgi:hypothetical protein